MRFKKVGIAGLIFTLTACSSQEPNSYDAEKELRRELAQATNTGQIGVYVKYGLFLEAGTAAARLNDYQRAIEFLVQGRCFYDAALIAEKREDTVIARDCYERGGHHADAARLSLKLKDDYGALRNFLGSGSQFEGESRAAGLRLIRAAKTRGDIGETIRLYEQLGEELADAGMFFDAARAAHKEGRFDVAWSDYQRSGLFETVREELVRDARRHLTVLIEEARFDDAVQLASLIDDEKLRRLIERNAYLQRELFKRSK